MYVNDEKVLLLFHDQKTFILTLITFLTCPEYKIVLHEVSLLTSKLKLNSLENNGVNFDCNLIKTSKKRIG